MHFREAVQHYMGQSDQAEDKWTLRGRESDEGWSEWAKKITRIRESKRMTEMEKIGQWQLQGGKIREEDFFFQEIN